jgi:[ribosomal protein S5]-alanine N-acetyltransferase
MSFIETERLLIRTWMASDAERVEKMFADREVMRYIGTGGPWAPERTRELIGVMIERYERSGVGVWPVVLKADSTVIGECGLQPLPGSTDVEIAYLFDKPYWGAGYAYEAACAVLEWGFNQHGLQRIVAVVSPENARSIALINRLGMRFEKVTRAYKHDLLKYAKAKPKL